MLQTSGSFVIVNRQIECKHFLQAYLNQLHNLLFLPGDSTNHGGGEIKSIGS